MKEQLTPLEVTKIEQFNKDEVLVEAVRKVLLACIYSHGVITKGYKHNPLLNGAFSLASLSGNNPIPDDVIGQQLRAQWAGVNALEQGFNTLSEIRSEKPAKVKEPKNEAI